MTDKEIDAQLSSMLRKLPARERAALLAEAKPADPDSKVEISADFNEKLWARIHSTGAV
jgi:hypothetical protein